MTGGIALFFAATLVLTPFAGAGQASAPPGKPAGGNAAGASTSAAGQSPAPPAAPADVALVAAQNLVGRALILRSFYAANNLAFDATGRVEGTPKSTDWTLADVNVLKAARRGPETIELEGVRVAIRHPLNDDKMKLLLTQPPNPSVRGMEGYFNAIFSIGIDPALQRSMPAYWRHYFDPTVAWPPDALAGTTVFAMYGQPDQPKDVTGPVLAHKTDAEFTDPARHDNVKGPVQLRLVVDAAGLPQRIAVTRPLGYGLDERAAESIAKWRFTPAMRAGKPVAAGIVVNLDFENAPQR
jgi:TonB family protein